MRVLVIKTSSLGDVIHTLPALTDAMAAIPGIRFDWVVEEAFAEIPAWHPAVDRVIPVALRRWRKSPWEAWRSSEWKTFRQALKQSVYDVVIDAQGLLKSALITTMSRGPSFGLDRQSAREPLASLAYRHPMKVAKGGHAIDRVRQLFAQVLGYDVTLSTVDYGIDLKRLNPERPETPYLVFLHGTTWQSKHYPEKHWRELAHVAVSEGYRVLLPWGNDEERLRGQRISQDASAIALLPRMGISQLAGIIAGADGVVAVDTGLAHLASALTVPVVVLVGPTDPVLTGVVGKGQKNISTEYKCMPCLKRVCDHRLASNGDPVCFETLLPRLIFDTLRVCMKEL
ncbi:MAG: lipopolysaccharide heptosyltransferase I [Candidatus Thiodiazotropha sp. (ex Semelilucina semeliformis)]|nr:lipopolysaccharide heptosyltransferase I [Candidatus Thiodiazotropha sp. (ex Semelilucina semeliformis)]